MTRGHEQSHSRPGVSSVTPPREKTIQVPVFSEAQLAAAGGISHPVLHGQYMFEEFLSEEEQEQLLQVVDRSLPAWTEQSFNGRYRQVLFRSATIPHHVWLHSALWLVLILVIYSIFLCAGETTKMYHLRFPCIIDSCTVVLQQAAQLFLL